MEASDWGLLVAAAIVGSFVGVVIRRLPEARPIAWGRSQCEHCGTPLAARDLVPVLSWVIARGHCRHCGARLGWFYPAVETATLAIALTALAVDRGAAAWLDFALGAWLLTLAWIDAEDFLLPDALTLPLVLAGLTEAALLTPDQLVFRAAGAAGGFVGLSAVGWAYRKLRGREGLGGGDAKLLAAAGAWVGLAGLPSVLLEAAVGALVFAGGLALAGAALRPDTALPFGPFLALAFGIVWLFGPLPL